MKTLTRREFIESIEIRANSITEHLKDFEDTQEYDDFKHEMMDVIVGIKQDVRILLNSLTQSALKVKLDLKDIVKATSELYPKKDKKS